MIERALTSKIEQALAAFPVVAITGPRQVGKTTLAREVFRRLLPEGKAVYLDLELPSDLHKLSEPELYLRGHEDRLVMIDEVQRLPALFPLIRALVDLKKTPGRFLLLGSASPELMRQGSETLAGRIVYHELTPFTFAECGAESISRLWLRGGYPLSFLAENDTASMAWREPFIQTHLERDIPQLGMRAPAMMLRRFWTMMAHYHGQLWNASSIAAGLGLSPPTASRYLDILTDTFMVRQLLPFAHNVKKRLVKSPKVYIRDSGLLHALLRIENREQLMGHPILGASWEGFVLEQVLSLLPARAEAFFYRTAAGAEIDLLLFDARGRPVAVEVKYSATPKVSRGFWSAMEDLWCRNAYVLFPGEEAYPLAETVYALPLPQIGVLLEALQQP